MLYQLQVVLQCLAKMIIMFSPAIILTLYLLIELVREEKVEAMAKQ